MNKIGFLYSFLIVSSCGPRKREMCLTKLSSKESTLLRHLILCHRMILKWIARIILQFFHEWSRKKVTYAPFTARYRFIRMKLLVTLSGINSFICSSAIVRASGNVMSFGRLTRRIAANTSPIDFNPGDVVIGDTSTIMAFSTRCG